MPFVKKRFIANKKQRAFLYLVRELGYTQKEAQRLRDLTGKEVDWLYQKHLWSLKKYAAEMAVKLAREKIRKDLLTPTHHQLIQKSIDNLEKVYEKFSAR